MKGERERFIAIAEREDEEREITGRKRSAQKNYQNFQEIVIMWCLDSYHRLKIKRDRKRKFGTLINSARNSIAHIVLMHKN